MSKKKYDFGGWATKNDLKCADGRVIIRDAFKHNDGAKVPLVWNHEHDNPYNVLGHALLENRPEGVYAYCSFNDTDLAKASKEQVQHGDIEHLSIYANKLIQQGSNVVHGFIREVSLVMAGANPGANIDTVVLAHSDGNNEEAIISTDASLELMHNADDNTEPPTPTPGVEEHLEGDKTMNKMQHSETNEDMTVQEVLDTFNEDQKALMYAFIEDALATQEDDDDNTGGESMKQNAFSQAAEGPTHNVLSHSDMVDIMEMGQRAGSFRRGIEDFMSEQATLQHGIDNIEYMFPEAKLIGNEPTSINRNMDWVSVVIGGAHKTPFSRIKSLQADLTQEEARAKGYIKGNEKIEQVFSMLKRTTTPTTIYKKQKIDRDDLIDITDFNVAIWIRREMRIMLDEEIARAILIGDGRLASSDDKINELSIRPIVSDDNIYTIKHFIPPIDGTEFDTTDKFSAEMARQFIRAAVRSRKLYKGSGSPTLFLTEDTLTECLLLEDTTGRVIYDDINKLKTALRVNDIQVVAPMDGAMLYDSASQKEGPLLGIIVNLRDYNIGADKGGEINNFEDFDIDYNANKYLIETRISGALVLPFAAIAIGLEL